MSMGYYESALLRLRRITAYLSLRYGNAIKGNDRDLTTVQFEILLYLASTPQPVPTVTSVAEFMLVDRSTSSRVLKGMQDRDLIQMVADTSDRRCRQIELTRVGKELVDKYRNEWLGVEKVVAGQYNEAIEHLERF